MQNKIKLALAAENKNTIETEIMSILPAHGENVLAARQDAALQVVIPPKLLAQLFSRVGVLALRVDGMKIERHGTAGALRLDTGAARIRDGEELADDGLH